MWVVLKQSFTAVEGDLGDGERRTSQVIVQDSLNSDSVAAAIRAIDHEHTVISLVLLAVLPLAAASIWRLYRGKPVEATTWRYDVVTFGGCTVAAVYAMVAVFLAVCWGGASASASGEARLARARAAPVVRAIERYRVEHRDYPRTLTELVPEYLSAGVLDAPDAPPLTYPFSYVRDSAGYQLSLQYGGPGMNECRIRPNRPWDCHGHF